MILSLLSVFLLSPMQDAPPVDCVARPSDCRTLREYSLKAYGQTIVIDGGAVVPWFQDGALMVFVGESVVVDVDGEKPVVESHGRASEVLAESRLGPLLGLVQGVTDEAPRLHSSDPLELDGPDGRLRISFIQGPGVEDMILTVENGYEGALTYRAVMMALGPDGQTQWARTSVCTVPPGIYVFEHWPHAIVGLALGGFAIAPKDAPVEPVCI